MDSDKKTKLDQLIWRKRIRSITPAIALTTVLLAIYIFISGHGVGERTMTTGTVQSWISSGKSHYPKTLFVELADGTNALVKAGVNSSFPKHGENIQIERRKSESGRISYHWSR